VTVSGGKARFEHGGSLCALTVVAGSVDITNVTGCDDYGYLRVGPGPVHLNMADVGRYSAVYIDGMKGRLGGKIETQSGLVIKNSVVEFDTFEPRAKYAFGASLSLDNTSLTQSKIVNLMVWCTRHLRGVVVYRSRTPHGEEGASTLTLQLLWVGRVSTLTPLTFRTCHSQAKCQGRPK
jgi:hypothetical protein